jgi:LysM repeat protein
MRRAALLGAVVVLALASACARRGRLVQRQAALPARQMALQPVEPLPGAQTYATISVGRGESLWSLARRHLASGARWRELAELNGLAAPWVLQPGQILRLPVGVVPKTGGAPPLPAARRPVNEAAKYGWARWRNRAWTVGEKLTFAVQYGAVTAGYATLEVTGVAEVQGRPAFHIVAEARTHPFFETFFKVRDRLDSYVDVDHGHSLRYEKHLREGSYQADAFYLFDQRLGKIVEPTKNKEAPMPIGSQDVLSCFYWFRTLETPLGGRAHIMVTADDMKNYELSVDVLRREKVSTLAGDFDCLVVQPHLRFQGVFQQKGEVFIWLTNDERRIPVKIRSKIAIGSININLQNAEWIQPAPVD